jgi:parallel beta-helix repeat protein
VLNAGTATLTNCTISGNSATTGGGVWNGDTATLTNCTISGNNTGLGGGFGGSGGGFSGFGGGGGVFNGGMATLTNCTVSGNAATTGGGVYNSGYPAATLTLANTIVAGNTASGSGPDAFGTVNSLGYNLVGITDGSTGWRGDGSVRDHDQIGTSASPLDPLLGPLADNGGPTQTMALLPGSPAIDAGTAAGAPCTDQRGFGRIGAVDIGAFESQGTALVVNTTAGGAITDPGQLSLPQAVNLANALPTADTITFSSLFNTAQTITLTGGQLTLTDSATTTISGPAAGVTISGNNASRVFGIEQGASAALSGLTITGGHTSVNGAGVIGAGAGVLNQGTATLTNCNVSGNSATNRGGGVYTSGGATTTMTNCTVSGNTTGVSEGNGVDNFGTMTLTDCTIRDNNGSDGDGMVNFGTATLTRCTINGNVGRDGGGLFNGGTATLTDCTISGNSAISGGGVFNQAAIALTNCTVSGNTANGFVLVNPGPPPFGGIVVVGGIGGGLSNSGTATLTNTIIAGNTAAVAGNTAAGTGPDVGGSVTSNGNNLIGKTDGSSGWIPGSDQIGTSASPLNPLLAPLGNYGGPTQTMALLPGSPAIDAGNNALVAGITTDQRELPRVVNGTVDIGAFESSGFTIALVSGSGQSTNLSTAFSAPQVVKVTAINSSEPVTGGQVTFTAPASGASATFTGSPATIGADGTASVTATANGTAGSYAVSATASGITTPASFSLTNRPTIGVPAAQTAYENVDLVFSGISIGDAAGATLTVTLGVSHGTLTLGMTSGLTMVSGNGTGSVSLMGSTANLNAALGTLVYRGALDSIVGDTLSITATDSGVSATPAGVQINMVSIAQQVTNLQAQVSAWQTAGVLNQGQANALTVKLNLKGTNGDVGKVQAFLNQVAAYLNAGILTQAEADALLGPGNILLLSVMRS